MIILITTLLLLTFISAPIFVVAQDRFLVTDFHEMNPGDSFHEHWYDLVFRNVKRTQYELVADEKGKTVVKAISNASASGLIRQVNIDPNEYPIIEFKWKIQNVVPSGDVTQRSGDDYAARIYITFDIPTDSLRGSDRIALNLARTIYGREQLPTRAMNYIWATKGEPGSIHPNPWTHLSQMIIVESGNENAGQWITVRRNILEDYRAIFGSNPPRITAIALMSDSDNTGESAVAWYSEIAFYKENPMVNSAK